MKSHFNFNNQERSGIFYLLFLIAALQLGYFTLEYYPNQNENSDFAVDSEKQKIFDSMVLQSKNTKAANIRSFNPNYISDYKGYILGLSSIEIDRLHAYRSKDKFVNSKEEFQNITGISDSLLFAITPYFKFPDWTQTQNFRKNTVQKVKLKTSITDINKATISDLRKVNGIGEKLSARIIKFRNRLGGFLVNEQLYDVYGLDVEVADRALNRFQVLHPPSVKKININTATVAELASLVYIKYHVAENIVSHREQNGNFIKAKDLFNVPEFPINKIERIELYLSY